MCLIPPPVLGQLSCNGQAAGRDFSRSLGTVPKSNCQAVIDKATLSTFVGYTIV